MSKFVWIAIAGGTVICIILAVALRVSRVVMLEYQRVGLLLSLHPSMLRVYIFFPFCDDERVLDLITSCFAAEQGWCRKRGKTMLSKDMFDDMKEMQAFDWDVRTPSQDVFKRLVCFSSG